MRSLVVDPSNPDRFYLGTLDGQIYTSADGGRTWQLLYNFNKPKLFVDHIIVDPRDSKTLYVAAHRHKEAGGFFKSTDGGRRWRESSELKNEALHSLTQAGCESKRFDCRNLQWHLSLGQFGRLLDAVADSQNAGSGSRRVVGHRSARDEHHLRRHLVFALQVHRRRAELEEHQERDHRRFRHFCHRHRPARSQPRHCVGLQRYL